MLNLVYRLFSTLFVVSSLSFSSDVPVQFGDRLVKSTTQDRPEEANSSYFWKSARVGDSAQLLTLFCRSCFGRDAGDSEVPLVSVLRDTLGDRYPENDRVSYVWLLSAPHLGLGQKLLAAVPFFYWRVGEGSKDLTSHDLKPQVNLTAPLNPVMSGFTRQLVQWTAFDPLTTWVRAPSRSYQANAADDMRFHLEETISYLRHAPASNDADSLTAGQLKTVMARLELRKNLLGGLANRKHVVELADESNFENERIRSRNWELMRQCAEKTGLYFEPFDLGGTTGRYAILWYPIESQPPETGTSLKPVWRLLNISDPRADGSLQNWNGLSFQRQLDDAGRLLPIGANGAREVRMIPLAFYSLTYPNAPLLLVDFRDKLHIRRHEMLQRAINEVTSGIIGISHFTNWYYYAGAMAYNFVSSRHGSAVNQAQRLDSYSQFRADLALDRNIDRRLYAELSRRSNSLRVSPLDTTANNSTVLAQARYDLLLSQTDGGSALLARLDKDRRAEAANFGQSVKSSVAHHLLHFATLGIYTHRVRAGHFDLNQLNAQRRFSSALGFLDGVIENGTPPEAGFSAGAIRSSIVTLTQMSVKVHSQALREHALSTVEKVETLTGDPTIVANCRIAKVALNLRPVANSAKSSPPEVAGNRSARDKTDSKNESPAEPAGAVSGLASTLR